MSSAPALHGIIALQTDNIPHLLGINLCVELNYSGKDNKLDDAINLYAFATELVKQPQRPPALGTYFQQAVGSTPRDRPMPPHCGLGGAIQRGTARHQDPENVHANQLGCTAFQTGGMDKPREDDRRQDQPANATPDGGKRKRQLNKTTKQATAGTQKTPVAVTPTPAPPQAPANPQDICARNLFHKADPALFQGSCKPGCKRNHNPRLRNGKLTQPDKEAVKASLEAMTGKFADMALQELSKLGPRSASHGTPAQFPVGKPVPNLRETPATTDHRAGPGVETHAGGPASGTPQIGPPIPATTTITVQGTEYELTP
eukprot:gene31842-42474_t